MADDLANIFIPIEVQKKMSMGSSSSAHSCKISMLWNWYTIDSCFLAKSWHVKSRGMFAGTCIGIFFWVIAYCWFHRFIVEYDNSILDYKIKKYNLECQSCCGNDTNNCCDGDKIIDDKSSSSLSSNKEYKQNLVTDTTNNIKSPGSDLWTPLKNTFSHRWYLSWMNKEKEHIYPNPIEHIGRSGLYLIEWTVSYLIMLMWMYYNGYVIITMILGYFFGQLLFNYTPLTIMPKRDYTTPSC
ncbi:Copper Transporter integral membrane protein that functions in high affinity copper transport [Pichia californica]|nr:Copper Transporter integral membrane protein that functions in high affinity copper transport [[Candida] californica]